MLGGGARLTGVRALVELARDPLNRELLEHKHACAEPESKEELGDGVDDVFAGFGRVAALAGVDERLEGNPDGEHPAEECDVAVERIEPVDVPT